ncbi:hypothetical protein EXM22_02665 [Oceanispirochaeta crateris]|uniref:Uncharacterized protein n=1 Tax=Oceanispirochaeta crateris TaxID=2518645 RepID=A0A5C1QKA0_9SPIO|nr:hypothetical protein [Oceanispirochaeta crateris]QEN06946.1 hypothetical protein EXM22_02665 [Oceanispirochaeta crateris]
MKKMILISSLLCLFFSSLSLFAQTEGAALTEVPDARELTARENLILLTDYLGMSLEEAVEKMGMPDSLFSVRGPSEGQDSVVFLYEKSLSLYWADRHVWQLRVDKEFFSTDMPLFFGMSREESVRLLGPPDLEKEDFSIYKLPQRGYPVACALYFDEGLADLYIYRSDF